MPRTGHAMGCPVGINPRTLSALFGEDPNTQRRTGGNGSAMGGTSLNLPNTSIGGGGGGGTGENDDDDDPRWSRVYQMGPYPPSPPVADFGPDDDYYPGVHGTLPQIVLHGCAYYGRRVRAATAATGRDADVAVVVVTKVVAATTPGQSAQTNASRERGKRYGRYSEGGWGRR